MNARVFAVKLILEDIHGRMVGGNCPDCDAPLIVTTWLKNPFCYLCQIDEQAAEEARAELRRLKWKVDEQRLLDLGIIHEGREAFIL